jgi:UDPglucose 6-dehydrogenase
MQIAMIGTGYVGLVSGACFSEFGIQVICVDKDAEKIECLKRGEIPIFEPGLQRTVDHNVAAGRLDFTTDLASAVGAADAVFIVVGTPNRHGDGYADLSYVYQAAREIAPALQGYTVVVTKSTVPVGTCAEVARILAESRPDGDFDVVSNPEFLREGSAIGDFMRPDRVVIGAANPRAHEVMRELYRPLYLIETPILFTTLETAELTKYAANAFLATKITFINEIADLCEKLGGDVHEVAKGMGLDGRIGRKFLHPGPGYGGSCFPKDTVALARTARTAGAPLRLVESVVEVNEARKARMAERVIAQCGGSVQGKTIAVLGLTYKPNTDDMREAPSLEIVPRLQAAGATVRAFDPEGMAEARKLLEAVDWCDSAYDALAGAHAVVIVTEWNEFRALDLARVKDAMASPLMVDLRNIYDPEEMAAAGFDYSCIGRAAGRTISMPVNRAHNFDPTILREYDVRGVVGETLSGDDAYALGRAFGTVVARRGGGAAVVGYDGRLSSPELAGRVREGLKDCGLTVFDVGRGPSPMLYYAAYTLPVEAGVMITGSHNPPDYNGFKMVLDRAPFFGQAIQEMGRLAAEGDFETGPGRIEARSVEVAYVERLKQEFQGLSALKIAWDTGNGAAGEVLEALVQGLPGSHIILNSEIDGTFPNHHPDPTVPENLTQLRDTVLAEGCDLGLAFDGDGDRIGALDGQGRILWGDQIIMLIAREVLKDHPGAPIIADVKASQALFDDIARCGGRPIMWKTGHSLIKAKMTEEGAPFAGEMAAHLFFADRYFGFDDALYAALRLIEVVCREGRSLAELRDGLPQVVNTPETRFACGEARKWEVVDEVAARLKSDGAEVIDLDGVRVKTADGWWLLRASNTQDVLVARCESADETGLATLKAAVTAQLKASGLEAPWG